MIVQGAVPMALSRPHARYTLQPTSLTTRSLPTLLALRGPSGRSNNATGAWSIFADGSCAGNVLDHCVGSATDWKKEIRDAVEKSETEPPGLILPGNRELLYVKQGIDTDADKENARHFVTKRKRPEQVEDDFQTPLQLQRQHIAECRFGTSSRLNDGMAIERFHVRIEDKFPKLPSGRHFTRTPDVVGSPRRGETGPLAKARRTFASSEPNDPDVSDDAVIPQGLLRKYKPGVQVTFHGSHVFAGIRELVEKGVIGGEEMPAWMTGEAGVSVGIVKDGKISVKNELV